MNNIGAYANSYNYYEKTSIYYQSTTIEFDASEKDAAKEILESLQSGFLNAVDSFEKSSEEPAKASTYKPDLDKVRELKAGLNKNVAAFEQMVNSLFQKQGKLANFALEGVKNLHDILKNIQVDADTAKEAQAAIAEDGYWGVDQTSTRILDFAKAISGGDPSKIDLLENAFKSGYGQAQKAWGAALPDISGKTYDKVMEGFAAWRGGDVAEETESIGA